VTKSKSYDTIVFDFDGVLAESVSVKTDAFVRLYEEYGPDVVDKVVEHHLTHGGISRFEKFRVYHGEFLGQPLTDDEVTDLSRRFSELVEDGVINSDWVAGAGEVLDRHLGHVPMYVVSGTPDEEIKRIIIRRGMENYFVSVHGSPQDKRAYLQAILRQSGIAPGRLLMIGDALDDYTSACDVGAAFLGRVAPGKAIPFPTGVQTVTDLTGLDFRT